MNRAKEAWTFEVRPGDSRRVETFLLGRMPAWSRRRVRDSITAGTVSVNGRRAIRSHRLRVGDVVRVEAESVPAQLAGQPELSVPILYRDPWLVVVDKPAGMPSTALRSTDRYTLANFLAAISPPPHDRDWNRLESGLAHRLDTDTSGVLVAARDVSTHRALREQFSRGEVHKTYWVAVAGDLCSPGTIDWPIAHAPRHPRRMVVCRSPRLARSRGARAAHTSYRPVERFGTATLLEVEIATGVRHQIRVHLASLGHPVLGDLSYGHQTREPPLASRQLLHALRLELTHPATAQQIHFVAPVPQDFSATLDALRVDRSGRPRSSST